jgi:ribonuclease J
MNLVIHRGTHEIGGSCVEFISGDSRIILDLGKPLVNKDGTPFRMDDHKGESGPTLVSNGVLPDIAGLYEWDRKSTAPDGLLISHAHIDHYGFYSFVNNSVPYYLGEGTKKLIDLTVIFTNQNGSISRYKHFVSGIPFICGVFKITPYLMDHSAFDAYSFLIEAEGKKVLYSGDFREHGRKGKAFEWFLNNCPKEVDAILLEGTMLGREDEVPITEAEIEAEAVKLIKKAEGITLFYSSGQNIDRLVSFYRAAMRLGKTFVIDIYTAHILHSLHGRAKLPYPSEKYPEIRVFYPYWLSQKLAREGRKDLLYDFKREWISRAEISQSANEIVMLVRPSMVSDLEHIPGLEGGIFIYSLWRGYLKEKNVQRLIDFTKSRNMTFQYLHTSGHAHLETLKKMINEIKPKCIIPIHSFHPDQYGILGFPIRGLRDGDVCGL